MKILIEGERYRLEQVRGVFDDPKFYHQEGQEAVILSVGYYHSYERGELIYMLPKVFMLDKEITVFGINKDDLFNLESTETFKHKEDYNWIRQISVYFYNSLLEFKRRNTDSIVVQNSLLANLNTNINDEEYSYLDLLLSFVNMFKKNKSYILFKHIEHKSQQVTNPNWEKTIRKSTPLLNQLKQPIYSVYRGKKKVLNNEEELLVYFFSILNHFNKEHNLYLKIDKSFSLIKGSKFKLLQGNGLSKLRKIKYRYFNDVMKKLYHLCEIYFSKTDLSSIRKKKEEFISVNSYNIVFEDMIDKLFSDSITEKSACSEMSLKDLKYNKDGKIIDHIFEHKSLLDTSNIFYIGDSKYYKSGNNAGELSKYKQFTYAKNVIQYNIDLLNNNRSYTKNLRYRDNLTEGYNITPNFFIYGYVNNYKNFEDSELEKKGEVVRSFHFEKRLFDRDTLFLHQYKINFLYVLKAYSQFRNQIIENFREETKSLFRSHFIDFFSDNAKSGFEFYKYKKEDREEFVEKNFRLIIGKSFVTKDSELILTKHSKDDSLDGLLCDFEVYNLQ